MTTRIAADELSRTVTLRSFFTAPRVAQSFRSAALLAVTGASIALFVQEARGRTTWLDEFVATNTLPLARRHDILLGMGGAAFVFAISPLALLVWRRKDSDVDRVRKLALILSPLALLGLILPLFRLRPWQDQPLALSCATAAVVFLVEKTVAQSVGTVPPALWRRFRCRFRLPLRASLLLLAVVAAALAYGLFVSVMTIRYHQRLGTAAYDLGGYDNLFYNALKGRPLRGTVAVPSGENWSSLRTHAEFAIYVFLPFYALWPRAETLLCIQAFMVGLGAIPIYLLAAARIPAWSAFVLAAAYLLFAPIHSGNFYDFHFQPLGSTLILWCFYFLDTKRNVLLGVCFAIALACREDVSLSLAIAGLLMIGTGFRPGAGLVMALVSGAYFVGVRFFLMPHFGSWWFQDMYKDLLPAGDSSLIGVVKTAVSNPLYTLGTLLTVEKLLHVLKIFLPLAFLPLRRPCLWPGFLPAFLTTILTTGYHPTTDTTFQYIFYWVPFLFVGSILVLSRIRTEQGLAFHAAAVVAVTMATLITSFHWGAVFQRQTFASAWGRIELGPLTEIERRQLRDLRDLGAMVPGGASLAVSESEAAHVSNRLTVYALKNGARDADYVLYRANSGGMGADQAAAAFATGKYERVKELGNFVLLARVKGRVPGP